MPNVVTPFSRKHRTTTQQSSAHPRHRREGYFDEQDQWHEVSDTTDSTDSAEG